MIIGWTDKGLRKNKGLHKNKGLRKKEGLREKDRTVQAGMPGRMAKQESVIRNGTAHGRIEWNNHFPMPEYDRRRLWTRIL